MTLENNALAKTDEAMSSRRIDGSKVTIIPCEDKDSGDAQIKALLQNAGNAKPIVVDLKNANLQPVAVGHGKSYFDKLSAHKEYTAYGNYPVTAQKEFNVDTDGFSFLVIYGTHINGGFCCIPNWQFGCELSTPDDTFYNTEMLSRRFDPKIAKAIAYGIRDACHEQTPAVQWVANEDGVVVCGRCKTSHTVTESGAHQLSPYCPHCGADLRTSLKVGYISPAEFREMNWKNA